MPMSVTRISKVGAKEAFVVISLSTLAVATLAACQNQQDKPNIIQTPTIDAKTLYSITLKAEDSLGSEKNHLGQSLSSFKVDFPAQTGMPASTASGTIFEIVPEQKNKAILDASHVTLGLFVPKDDKTPVPVLINHVSGEGSLINTPVDDGAGNMVTRYGIAAMPLDEQYLETFIKGDLKIGDPLDKYLKKDKVSNQVVPIYTILFKDITPDNVKAFCEEVGKLRDPAQIQSFVLSHIYGVTFNDPENNRSMMYKLTPKNKDGIKEFIANLFFGSDMVAQAQGLSAADMTAQAPTPEETATATAILPPAETAIPAPHIEMAPLPEDANAIPHITADEISKLYPGGMSEIVKAYNDRALELSHQKPWTGALATGFRTDKNNNRGFIFLAMNLDRKANIADEVPVEFMTSIINQGDGKLSGGELLFPDAIPAAESEWGAKINLLLVNSVIHTNFKNANGKFIDLAFTSITDLDLAFGTGGVENKYPEMSNSFGHNRPFTAMPMFNFGSLLGDQFGAAMTLKADQQKIFFISPNGTKKEMTMGEAKAKIGEAFRGASTEQDFKDIQMMLDQVTFALVNVTVDSFNK